ncbi:hypothetical protein OPT61_g8856 [Boeremia exigua]|uniref:Uncharacterized protein n=1 Tax=Boeremia exigua TaxID=749465 RepID=A0ACC2HWW1_9PLEO|nr:hypothetical protein OPT61_g8856 [Boeremia exigua]
MNRTRANRASSGALLRKQLASITETLGRATQREVEGQNAHGSRGKVSGGASAADVLGDVGVEGTGEEDKMFEEDGVFEGLVSEVGDGERGCEGGGVVTGEGRCEELAEAAETAEGFKARGETSRRAECGGEAVGLAFNDASDTRIDPSMPSIRGGDASLLDDDPTTLLAELRGLSTTANSPQAHDNDTGQDREEIGRLRTELDEAYSLIHTTALTRESDDPRAMLAELATLSAHTFQNTSHPDREDDEDDEDDEDIALLHARLQDLRSPSNQTPPPTTSTTSTTSTPWTQPSSTTP